MVKMLVSALSLLAGVHSADPNVVPSIPNGAPQAGDFEPGMEVHMGHGIQFIMGQLGIPAAQYSAVISDVDALKALEDASKEEESSLDRVDWVPLPAPDEFQQASQKLWTNMIDDPQKRLETLTRMLGLPQGTDSVSVHHVLEKFVEQRYKDHDGKSWPFLKRFKNTREMEKAEQDHMAANPGKFTRIQNRADGELALTTVSEVRWLQDEELEMSCHTDLVPNLCHRATPVDHFGVVCVRYMDPTTHITQQKKVGIACHNSFKGMCHVALDFIVDAAAAAEVHCPRVVV